MVNVPKTPSTVIGTAATRNRFQPTRMPPSKRIRISATTATRSTSSTENLRPRLGQKCTVTAAASRKIAGAGIGKRSLTLFERTASETTPATTRITRPKCVISLTARA